MEETELTGYVSRIKFRSPKNGYTVLMVDTDEDDVCCVGNLADVNEGDCLCMKGSFGVHAVYGEQFLVESYEIKEPEDVNAMERYLASGAIKGVGAKLAARIVRRFKEDTFRIMEEEPERLSQIKGITARRAQEIAQSYREQFGLREIILAFAPSVNTSPPILTYCAPFISILYT